MCNSYKSQRQRNHGGKKGITQDDYLRFFERKRRSARVITSLRRWMSCLDNSSCSCFNAVEESFVWSFATASSMNCPIDEFFKTTSCRAFVACLLHWLPGALSPIYSGHQPINVIAGCHFRLCRRQHQQVASIVSLKKCQVALSNIVPPALAFHACWLLVEL